MESSIRDTGISIAYEPEKSAPVVDILFVHGLGGHPRKTWTCSKGPPGIHESLSASEPSRKNSRRSALDRALDHLREISRNTASEPRPDALRGDANPAVVFWPVDLLSKDFPDSRILVFGYDSKITKYSAGAVSENSVFSHAKDLLFALALERPLHRPLICVAHSLGGIIFKEMLSRSSSSTRREHQNILESVEAVIFLGTPHRGSVDIAAKGEVARSLLSALGVATTPVILDSLGLKNTDLERAQEEFSRLWHTSNFRVKTFQEGLILPKLGKKVVPEYSSLLGNHREHAETLQADHLEMCRYSGKDDPNYRKVAGEIRSTYLLVTTTNKLESLGRWEERNNSPVPSVGVSQYSGQDFQDQAGEAWLQSLWFPATNRRYETLGSPADQTCHWLFDDENFQDWLNGRNQERYQGLIWIKGKPGSGKSMLMGEAFRRATQRQADASAPSQTAAFFFSGNGDELEHSVVGLFRSLIYQLCSKNPLFMQPFQEICDAKVKTGCFMASEALTWQEAELKAALEKMILQKGSSKLLIFVDALDECDSGSMRDLAYFWRKITKSAFTSGIDLKVCLSSRHSPSVTKIRERSDGMFLWVVLVVDDLLRGWDEGRSLEYLTKRVENTPQALETLFSEMLSHLTPERKNVAVKLFQWATLSIKPLRLHEWHHIMGFIRHPTPTSLAEWRASDYFTETDEQLVKQINSLSLGLIEVTGAIEVPPHGSGSDVSSVGVDAGSLTLEHGGTRIVQVIHESVRDFFLRGNGFSALDTSFSAHPIGRGHLSIMATCLDYVNIVELDALVGARQRITHQGKDKNEEQSPTSLTESNSSCSLGHEEHPLQGTMTLPLRHKAIPGDDSRPEKAITGSPESHPFVAVHRWLEESGNSTAESDLLIDIPRAPFSDASDTLRSQILEDHPALLSYATFALFEHARLAPIDGTDITPILDRLNDETTWTRWKYLREDVPEGVELLDFLEDLGLDSWIGAFHDRFSRGQKRRGSLLTKDIPTSPIDTQRSALYTSHQLSGGETRRSSLPVPLSIPQVDPQEHPPPMSPPRWRGDSPQSLNRVPRRQVSVASFGSASSHDGYDRFSPRLESPRPVNSKDFRGTTVNSQDFGRTKVIGFFVCECCPKKPKKFDTQEELAAHESEKQFECPYCENTLGPVQTC
ncbi:hypothetical protein FPRO05_12101 [Fusarium proliferatum]|uniref:Uncharacterized protein n=1 Tax=Gibberella intermedia TaxID=948311 RepID=A0A365N4Z1_GIBIN|nr:hypothetical protein FPRO05_12101 [Fusarium proliferatum]